MIRKRDEEGRLRRDGREPSREGGDAGKREKRERSDESLTMFVSFHGTIEYPPTLL